MTVAGAVLSLAGAANAETGITCCAIGHPSVASLDTSYPGDESK
ncbi:hypothetical protein ACIQUM_31960 [Amycolatopsis azurea]